MGGTADTVHDAVMDAASPLSATPRHGRWRRWFGWAMTVLAIVAGGLLIRGGYATRSAHEMIPATGTPRAIGAVFLSGDMGLRFGPGPSTTAALAAHGIPVDAVSSPPLFKTPQTRGDIDRIIADLVRGALAATHRDRLVLIGRSYGADVLQTGLADLPIDLRRHVAAVILIVPGDKVYFHTDPTSLSYRGMPDNIGAATVNRLDWAPLTCIYGAAETESLCPDVMVRGATIVAMPGGHFLDHDEAGLLRHLFTAIDRIAPVGART